MPSISRWFARAGLIYLVLGLAVGVLSAFGNRFGMPALASFVGPVFVHLLVVGWVTQLIVAVMIWMFPIHSKDNPRGNERLWWAILGLLNAGLLLRLVAEPLHAMQPSGLLGTLLVVSAILQWVAGMGIVVNVWPRIKGR